MGLEMILLLAGSGLGIAVLGIVAYRTVPGKAAPPAKVEVATDPVSPPKPIGTEVSPEPEVVSEAPPPFSEDATQSTKSIAAPTDPSAMSSASPFVTIALPKAASRANARTRKRKRSVKPKTLPVDLSGAIPSLNPPEDKEPSAA